VTIGVSQADDASIDQGLAPGELVVVDGTEKLREGSKVDIKASGPPKEAVAPKEGRPKDAAGTGPPGPPEGNHRRDRT
jgi:multidrug efflux system membrane fusion protein